MKKFRQPFHWEFTLGLLVFVCGVGESLAVNWDGGGATSEWTEAANWEFDLLPGFNDTATITNDTALITGAFPPLIKNLDVGLGFSPGELNIIASGGPSILEVTELVRVGALAELSIGSGSNDLVAGEVLNFGEVTVGVGSEIFVFQEYLQRTWPFSNTRVSGELRATEIRIENGELTGAGLINGNLTVGAVGDFISTPRVVLGAKANTLHVDGNVVLHPNAELSAKINTSGPMAVAKQLDITGMAQLGGTLNLEIVGGNNIPRSQQVEVVLANSFVPGTSFDNIVINSDSDEPVVVTMIPGGIGGLTASVRYHTSDRIGDMFNDDVVDEKDARFFAWALRDAITYRAMFFNTGYTEECPSTSENPLGICGVSEAKQADIDGDTLLTFADIPAFLDLVNQSGGSVASAQSEILSVFSLVPEPNSRLLVLVALGCASFLRHYR